MSRTNAIFNYAVCAVGLPIAVATGNALAITFLAAAVVGTAVLRRRRRT